MAKKKKFDTAITVQLSQELRDRIRACADHPRIEDSEASVIRDCIETALPGFEMELGLVDPADEGIGYAEAMILQGDRPGSISPEDHARLLGKEDRSAGCFGGPLKVGDATSGEAWTHL